MTIKKSILLLFFVILLLSVTNCNRSQEDESKQQAESQNPVPQELNKIEESIEDIITTLSGPGSEDKDKEKEEIGDSEDEESKKPEEGKGSSKEEDKGGSKEEDKGGSKDSGDKKSSDKKEGEEQEKDSKKKDDKKSEDSSGKQSEDKGSKSDGDSTGEDSSGEQEEEGGKKSQAEISKKNWKKITKTIEKLHSTWNSYAPTAVKDGVDSELMTEFSNTLNKLTNSPNNNAQMLLTANALYAFVPQAIAQYDTPVPSGVKKAKYYARNSILNSNIENWDQAITDLDSLDATWSVTKDILDSDQKETIEQIDYSIKNLREVTEAQNKKLVKIKGDILMKNIKKIEKSLKEKEEEKEES